MKSSNRSVRIHTIAKVLQYELYAWMEAFVSVLPGNLGSSIRKFYYKFYLKNCSIGSIEAGCKIVNPATISLGRVSIGSDCKFISCPNSSIVLNDYSSMNSNVHINSSCGGKIIIGSYCLIGPGVVFRTASHRYMKKSVIIRKQGHDCGDIILGNDVWLGANVVVLGGVTLGEGCVVGAGAVVTRSVPPYSVVLGVPARVVKFRV